MIYYRNFCSLLLIVFLGISLIGCGAEVPSEPGTSHIENNTLTVSNGTESVYRNP